jgi:hypothetical protein
MFLTKTKQKERKLRELIVTHIVPVADFPLTACGQGDGATGLRR